MVFGVGELVTVKSEVGLEVGESPMVMVGSGKEVVEVRTSMDRMVVA